MCCGHSRPFIRPSTTPRAFAPATLGNGPVFEYVGQTALTVVGPLSGARYRFDRPGVRREVDPRDAAALARIPVLRSRTPPYPRAATGDTARPKAAT